MLCLHSSVYYQLTFFPQIEHWVDSPKASGPDWIIEAVLALVFIFIMTLVHRYVKEDAVPVYLSLDKFDQVKEVLEDLGISKIKEKDHVSKYKIKYRNWPENNRIILEKTPYHLCIKCPEDFTDFFSPSYMNNFKKQPI